MKLKFWLFRGPQKPCEMKNSIKLVIFKLGGWGKWLWNGFNPYFKLGKENSPFLYKLWKYQGGGLYRWVKLPAVGHSVCSTKCPWYGYFSAQVCAGTSFNLTQNAVTFMFIKQQNVPRIVILLFHLVCVWQTSKLPCFALKNVPQSVPSMATLPCKFVR